MFEELNGEITEKYIRRCHKRLRELNAPLENWRCVEVVDGETADFNCELCDCHKVGFIHVMEHSNYNGLLQVGCICAGIMEGDLIAAKARDDEARRKSQRRSNFRKKKWNEISENKWSVKYKQRSVLIERDAFRGRDFYKISIDSDRYQWWNNRRIETLEDAKRCVFELIDWEKTQ